MRNYFQIEKTEDGIFIAEGTGTPQKLKDYDYAKSWNKWEAIENEEMLFKRIKELLKKGI